MRFTVDLERDAHRQLKYLAVDRGVPAVNVVRALIDLIGRDDELRERVGLRAEEIAEEERSRRAAERGEA